MIKVSTTGMAVSLKTDLRFPISGQWGHGDRIIHKGVIKRIRHDHPDANIVAIDYDPGASEVNQLNRIKLMLSTAQKKLKK